MLSANGSDKRAAAVAILCIDIDHIGLREKAQNLDCVLLSALAQHFLEEFVDNEHGHDQLFRSLDRFSEEGSSFGIDQIL